MTINILRQAVQEAGGARAVGDACGVSYQAVQKWAACGLPRTEFTKETTYAATISGLARARGFNVSNKALLIASVELRKKQAA